jgi:hypothetical protein
MYQFRINKEMESGIEVIVEKDTWLSPGQLGRR